jgi:hypothetical protein
MKRMQTAQMDTDFFYNNKAQNLRISAFENPCHPLAILFWNTDDTDASSADGH